MGRLGSWTLAAVALAVVGCGGKPPVATGEYELSIVPLLEPGFNFEGRFELEPDGEFRGHEPSPELERGGVRLCEGTLGPEQQERLRDAIVDVGLLDFDLPPEHERCGIDTARVEVEISAVAGPREGETNGFLYDRVCQNPAVEPILDLVYGIVASVEECTGEWSEY